VSRYHEARGVSNAGNLRHDPQELALIVGRAHWLRKYHWYALGNEVHEAGGHGGGIVAALPNEEEAQLVAAMHNALARSLGVPEEVNVER
jgi:hypothetical protein